MAYIYGSGSLSSESSLLTPGTSYKYINIESDGDQELTAEEALLSGLGLRRIDSQILSYAVHLVTNSSIIQGRGYCDHFYFIAKQNYETSFQKDPILLEARFNNG